MEPLMFKELEEINTRPEPFEFYTADELWTNEHTARQMLSCHLNPNIDMSSRNAGFIGRSVEWIVSRFAIGPETKIADFGCGPGLYTTKLAAAGAQVTGVDFSANSIQYARDMASKNHLSIDYVNQNYLEFETENRFDLILMIMCDFCVLSPAQRRRMLDKFRAILSPGGSVLLDVYTLTAFEGRTEKSICEKNLLDGFWSPDDYYGFLNIVKYEEDKVVLDKYTIVETLRTRTVYNWLQYFSMETIEQEFAEAGLAIREFHSDVAGSPFDPKGGEMAVIAAKTEAVAVPDSPV